MRFAKNFKINQTQTCNYEFPSKTKTYKIAKAQTG